MLHKNEIPYTYNRDFPIFGKKVQSRIHGTKNKINVIQHINMEKMAVGCSIFKDSPST